MSKHLQTVDITRSIDALDAGLHELVDLDATALDFEFNLTDPFEVRHTTDREQSLFSFDSRTILEDSSELARAVFDLFDSSTSQDLDTTLFEFATERLRDFLIESRDDVVSHLDDRHLRTERYEGFSHFDTDDATADDDEAFGTLFEAEDIVTGQDCRMIETRDRQTTYLRATSEDDLVSLDDVLTIDDDILVTVDLTDTAEDFDTVALEQRVDTARELLHYAVLVRDQLLHINSEAGVSEVDTTSCSLCYTVEDLSVAKERLGRDTTLVEAGTTELSLLNDSDLCTELCSTDSSYVASRATSDDAEVVGAFEMYQRKSSTFVLRTFLLFRYDLILRADGLKAFASFTDVTDDFGDGYRLTSLVSDLEEHTRSFSFELHTRLVGHDFEEDFTSLYGVSLVLAPADDLTFGHI